MITAAEKQQLYWLTVRFKEPYLTALSMFSKNRKHSVNVDFVICL